MYALSPAATVFGLKSCRILSIMALISHEMSFRLSDFGRYGNLGLWRAN